MARAVRHARTQLTRSDSGFSVVEIIIAMLLLAVVTAGVSMAFVGSTKVQGKARASASMSAVASRVFEHLQGDRDWMKQCASNTQEWCSLGAAAIPAELLDEKSFGDAQCSTATPLRLKMVHALALAVDSPSDGSGSQDRDGVRPDYFRVYLQVDIPANRNMQGDPNWNCDLDLVRLGSPAPAVLDSALDPRGDVPTGSVTVEVCDTTRQVDDRMPVAGCADSSGTKLRMMGCPSSREAYRSPATGVPSAAYYCANAWNAVTACAGCSNDWAAVVSPFVELLRRNHSFEIVDTMGNRYASCTEKTDHCSRVTDKQGKVIPGLYRFTDIPAGTYLVDKLQLGESQQVWDTKVIPTYDSDKTIRIAVQPDVDNRALIPIRWKPDGTLTIRFYRKVKSRQVVEAWSPMHRIASNKATRTFEFDQTKYVAFVRQQNRERSGPQHMPTTGVTALDNQCQRAHGSQPFFEICNWFNFYPYAHCSRAIQSYRTVATRREYVGPGPNGKPLYQNVKFLTYPRHTVNQTCSYYNMDVQFRYYYSIALPDQTFAGAPVAAGYATTPAPTVRDTTPDGLGGSSFDWCDAPVPASPNKARPARLAWGCVGGFSRYGNAPEGEGIDRVTLRGLTPGLWTGIMAQREEKTGYVWDPTEDWSLNRNESLRGFPATLRVGSAADDDPSRPRGMWLEPDAQGRCCSVITPAGKLDAGAVNPTVSVTGTGECYWKQPAGRSNSGAYQPGSCNPCDPRIDELGGSFKGACYLVVEVKWSRCVYATGYGAVYLMEGKQCVSQGGSSKQKLICPAAPQPGTSARTATNCKPPTSCKPSCGGTVSTPIPPTRHDFPNGRGGASVPETEVGYS
jgi:hypothetical protein